MGAPKGNKFWMLRSSHGRKPVFSTPEALWEAACEYFEWVESHPLQAAELVKYQGNAKVRRVPKMRAMTITALVLFLDISHDAWRQYKERKDFVGVCTRIDAVIRAQKFEGAAAELLNPSIIARDLGLADKQERDVRHDVSENLDSRINNVIELIKSRRKNGSPATD